jgi:hypothetical protein
MHGGRLQHEPAAGGAEQDVLAAITLTRHWNCQCTAGCEQWRSGTAATALHGWRCQRLPM